ncbi:MAG: hypothetical protein ACK5LV_07690 [Lachnospirales bacterium]
MDCQTILESKVELIKNKKIGRVIFIVEGNKTEVILLKKIFKEVLGYSFVSHNRESHEFKFINKNDKNSIIYVFNSKNSNISSISDENYLENQVEGFIRKKYDSDFAIEYAAVYYLFDRDYKSNDKRNVENLIDKYTNARDFNDYDNRQGLLLLSYPAIEAYFLECLQKDYSRFHFDLGKDMKFFVSKRKKNVHKLNHDNVLKGFTNTVKMIKRMKVKKIDLDDFKHTNKTVYDYQEKFLENSGGYQILSMLSIALLDLGIIKIKK